MFHYLDNAATTQTRPEAAQAAVTAMTEEWGNPSSRYAFGQEASGRLKEHRAQVAAGPGVAARRKCTSSPAALRGTTGPLPPQWRRTGGKENTSSPPPSNTPRCWSPSGSWNGRAMRSPGSSRTSKGSSRQSRWRRPCAGHHPGGHDAGEQRAGHPPARGGGRPAIRAAGSPALLHTDAVQGFLKVPFSARTLGADPDLPLRP